MELNSNDQTHISIKITDESSLEEDEDTNSKIPMWKRLASNQVSPESVKHTSALKKKRSKNVIRASNSMTNQDFLALAVIQGDIQKVKNVINAYEGVFADKAFSVISKFTYEINPSTMMVSCADEDFYDEQLPPQCLNLTILHLTCAFDQSHIMRYFLLYGIGMLTKLNTGS